VSYHLQIFNYEKSRSGPRCVDACEFVVKPEDGLDVNAFSCWVKFKQEVDDEEHLFYLNPGFTPLKVEKSTFCDRGSLYYYYYFKLINQYFFYDSCQRSTVNNKSSPFVSK